MNPSSGPTLRDIHLPPSPGWWPPAPGWWLLLSICLLCAVVAFIKLRKMYRMRRVRRAILRELDRCIESARGDPVALAAALSQFLRRMVLRETPAAAAYTGERWLAYLDQRARSDEFRRGIGRVLLDAPYRLAMAYDTAALIMLVRCWTRNALAAGAAHA